MKSKSNKWNCTISQNGEECFNENFKSIDDIATELNLSKHIVFDLASCRKKNEKYSLCRFFPKITITRLS